MLQALGVYDNHVICYPDRVELRTVHGFVPKASSSASLSEPWSLPAFSDQDSESLYQLDITIILKHYLQAMATFRSSPKLFIILLGKKQGQEGNGQENCTMDNKVDPEGVQGKGSGTTHLDKSSFHQVSICFLGGKGERIS